jgi:hypothetical protein
MRFGWALMAAVMLVAVACSDSGATLKPLPLKGFLTATGPDCSALGALKVSFTPTTSHAEAQVYAVKPVQVDSESVATMARKLGISGEPVHATRDFIAEDGSGRLVISELTGSVVYIRREPLQGAPGGRTMSEDEARRTAEQFLRNLGLPVPGAWAGMEVQKGRDGVGLTWRPADFREAELDTETYTPLNVDVTVENSGEIGGMWYFWQDLKPIGEYPLASEAEALERLRSCDGHLVLSGSGPVSFGGASIEYLRFPSTGPYQYFIPVYHFGNAPVSNGAPPAAAGTLLKELESDDAWVLAIADKYINAQRFE